MTEPQTTTETDDDDSRPMIVALIARAPWWVVSIVFHGLLIALIGLATWRIYPELLEVSSYTEMSAARSIHSESDVDPVSASTEIVVPPDILAKAELGERFETVTVDRKDLHVAFGNFDRGMFRSIKGSDDDNGGGMIGDEYIDVSIGNGGAGKGSGGGWGGGDGTGTGVDAGSGGGTFGQRNGGGRSLMVKRHGCGTRCNSSVDAALAWLAKHQESDGHWDAIKNGADAKTDTAVTALAALTFLGAGHSEKIGGYKVNVQRAVAWLISQQHDDGLVFDESDAGAYRGVGYPSAIATLALCEAAGMARMPGTVAAAQKAADYCMKTQKPDGGWRYRAGGGSDLSVTGWHVMALKSAKVAGLHVNAETWDGIHKFLDSVQLPVESKETGAGDFTPAAQYTYQPGYVGAPAPHRLCAIGNLARLFTGSKREDILSSADWFVQKGGPQKWGPDGENADFYYWYFGTLVNFQMGGDTWKGWNESMKQAILPNQCKSGDDAGSWPVAGAYAREWGRVGQTALGALCFEFYYCYERVSK